jgi:peptidyl-tRNA hydrolase
VKIAVKALESFLKKLIADYPKIDECKGLPDYQKFWTTHTIDEGRTQIEPGSLTTIAFNPAPKSELPKELLELKLL